MQRFVRKGLRRGGLRFERLEERWALAGDVFADFDDLSGNLTITGDAAENHIVVSFVDNDELFDEIVVAGINTTVNGLDEVRFEVNPLVGINDVDIDLGEARIPTRPRSPRGTLGVDTVEIGGFDIGGNLTITGANGGVATVHNLNAAGAGEIDFGAGVSGSVGFTRVKAGSVVTINNSSFAGLDVTTNWSNDTVVVVETFVDGDLSVNTGAGVDNVSLTLVETTGAATLDTGAGVDTVAGENLDIGGPTTVTTGADTDTVNFTSIAGQTVFHDEVNIDLGNGKVNQLGLSGIFASDSEDEEEGPGFEIVGNLIINGAGSVNVIALASLLVGGNVEITTAGGVDVIGASALDVAGDLNVNTGAGVDVVVIGGIPWLDGENHIGGETNIDTGSGNDVVVLAHTTFDGPVDISLGAGNDVLVMVDNQFNDTVSADGGSGNNRAIFDGTFESGAPNSLTNFRTRTPPNFLNQIMVDLLLARGLAFLNAVV